MRYELAASSWGKEEIEAMEQVIHSQMFTMSTHVKQFEKDFAQKIGSSYAVMVNSGSSANLIGIAALCFKKKHPLKPGDEIIVPPVAWATTYYPLLQYGLKLRFIDIELDTLNMDVSRLEEALTPKTRGIVAVSILGNPCALDLIRHFCDKHNLYLFEDNCESLGARLNGKNCGTFGDIGTFSLFFSHHISTIEGGVCVTDDEELYHLMLSLRSHGWTRHLPKLSPIYQENSDDFFEAYRFILPGYNVRPTELAGAIGIQQLKKLDQFIKIRRENGKEWHRLFKNDTRFIIQKENGESSYFAFTLILNPEFSFDRQKIMQILSQNDIEFRIITGGNFLRHDVIKYFDYECAHEIIHANRAHDFGFFVGNHPRDLKYEINYLYNLLDEATKPLTVS